MVYIIAFLIPALIWIISVGTSGIFPFGSNTIFTSDMAYQYAGYFEFVQKVLTEGVSPFFSFYKGMGEETLGMMAYYMMSPFNLILALFSEKNITEAVLLINLLKIGACGLTFSIFLKNKFKTNNSFAVVGFSTCYALMAYNIAYQFNIMWLDGVIWLPIIILGLERIIKNGKSDLFYISLTIGIISNWYIGFMLCIFSGLYVMYRLSISDDINVNKRTLKKLALFGILAAGTSLVVIIPSAITSFNEVQRSNLQENRSINYVLINLFSKFVIGGFDFWQITDYDYSEYLNLPNLFAGTTVLLLFICYFFNKSFEKKERIVDGVFGIILLIITLCVPLNRVFHVFTYNVWFPYRYSFCITFFMIFIAYKSFLAIKEIELKTILKIFLVMVAGYFVVEKLNYSYIVSETIYCTILMLSAAFIAIKLVKKKEKTSFLLLAIVMCTEMFINSAIYMQKIGYSDRNIFYEERAKLTEALDEIRNKNDGYYRIENNIIKDYNASMGKLYSGITSSSSMGKESSRVLLETLGYTRVANNYVKYAPTTKFADDFLGIKYYIDEGIKENENALNLGFLVKDSIRDVNNFVGTWKEISNSFEKQNELINKATGITENLYNRLKEYDVEVDNLEKVENKENTYSKIYPNSKATYSFKFDALNDNTVYLKINGKPVDRAKLYVNGSEKCDYMTMDNFAVINLGKFNKNDSVKVDLEFISDNEIAIYDIWLYYEDPSIYDKVINKLKTNQFNIVDMSGSIINGEIEVTEEGTLLFTIPYDKYLKVFVDGQMIESECVLDSLLAIKVMPGTHNIRILYKPAYLMWACIFSGGFMLLAFLIIFLEHRKSKRIVLED